MSRIIHRDLQNNPPIASKGNGIYLFDSQGRKYLDACGGAAVSNLGHSHPKVIAAMHKQIDKLAYTHTSFFSTEVSEELAQHLVNFAPNGLEKVYFVSGGSEAMEAALKLARQYFFAIGESNRTFFIARQQSYHGNTLGALAVGGNKWRRQQFAPLLIDVKRISDCNEYRGRGPDETLEQYTQRLINEFEEKILESGPQNIIAFVAETVVGATAGVVPPTPGYFQGIRKLCDQYGILYIADEVMCGMGRTGTLHAVEQENVVPDIMTLAKGLGGGYQPIGAVLVQNHIIETLKNINGLFQHGHTYIGHPVATAASLAVQKTIQEDNLLPKVQLRGEQLISLLRTALVNHPNIGDIRGRGLFIGIEFVKDRKTKLPFNPTLKLFARIKKRALENGLLIYPMSGTVDGHLGDHVLLAPPFIVSEIEVEMIVNLLIKSINEALATLPDGIE